MHNRALDMGWLLAPVLHKKLWPKIKYKSRRGITLEEHRKIVAAEYDLDYQLYFELLWETGGLKPISLAFIGITSTPDRV